MDLMEKLGILASAAKYDVACTSSGLDRSARSGQLGSTTCAGICHSFAADGRCITLLKVLQANCCIYDCAYCVNRRSNDVPRAAFTPRELAELTIGFYRRNYIEGLFVSSGVVRNPDYTMELMAETVRILREEEGFRGYVHAKSIPGASPELVRTLGCLVDRMSVNMELPSQASLDYLAPEKANASITAPMRLIQEGIAESAEERRLARRNHLSAPGQRFAPAGQSTQMIIGATGETDHHILSLTQGFYRSYKLKRVFFSAYLPVNDDARLPHLESEVPLTREHRLYQADWLLRFYGFDVSELLDAHHPDLDLLMDPKAAWALAHMERFPVEVNTAEYEELLRVPGIGVTGARRIAQARRNGRLSFEDLRTLGVSLKRAGYFLTCKGRMAPGFELNEERARGALVESGCASGNGRKGKRGLAVGQMSLFEDAAQRARDPFARAGSRDKLLDAARGALLGAETARPGAVQRLGQTPSGLPAADPLALEAFRCAA